MKVRLKILSGLTVSLLLLATAASADEKPKATEGQMAADAAMKTWMAFATPGEIHAKMAGLVGTWETTVKMYGGPGPATETKGTSTYTSLMDGRYIQETADGDFGGMPFHGVGIYGYDNALKKYVATWIDNMGTGIMYSTGTSDDGGKTINWNGKGTDPMSGQEQSYRSVMHQMTPDQYSFEMYGPGPDGKEMKMMEIMYARKR